METTAGRQCDHAATLVHRDIIIHASDRSKSCIAFTNPSDARTKRMHGRIAAEAKWLALWLSRLRRDALERRRFPLQRAGLPCGVGRGVIAYKTLHEEASFLHCALDGGAGACDRECTRTARAWSHDRRVAQRVRSARLNYLHSHGADVAEPRVLRPIRTTCALHRVFHCCAAGLSHSDSSSTPSAAPPEHDAGSLLLKVRREVCGVDANGDGGGDGGDGDDASIPCYFAIHPVEGELWAIPGDMHHCVMPREVPKRGLADALGRASLGLVPWLRKPLRISVAANVYAMTSAYRDKVIGFHRAAPASSESQQHSGSIAGCVVPCVSPRK